MEDDDAMLYNLLYSHKPLYSITSKLLYSHKPLYSITSNLLYSINFQTTLILKPMDSTRQLKIDRLIQKELDKMFLLQTKAMHGVMVTVSGCRVSSDLSYCNVYLSVFPSEKAAEIVGNASANVRTIRYDLGKRLRYQLRIIPELRFFQDDTIEYMQHIDELLKKDPPKSPEQTSEEN